jgi:hypothetical protein
MKVDDDVKSPRASITTEPGLPGSGSPGSPGSPGSTDALEASEPRASLAPLSDVDVRAQLDEVNRELATLRRRIDDLCKRGATLADEQHRRAAAEGAYEPVELPSGSFRALSRLS